LDLHAKKERATPEKAEQSKQPVDHEIKTFVTPLRESENATKGLATVQVGEMFKIGSIRVARVNENTKEGSENFGKNFVAMPSRPDKFAESGYRDVVHPVNKDFSEKLKGAVLKQYDNQVAWKQNAAKKEQPAHQQEKPAANKTSPDTR
jgi:DNA-binding cell septation regulator SpoVG